MCGPPNHEMLATPMSVAGSGTDRIGNVSIGDDVGMTTIDEADDISDGDS